MNEQSVQLEANWIDCIRVTNELETKEREVNQASQKLSGLNESV